jgi:hypothetical protein
MLLKSRSFRGKVSEKAEVTRTLDEVDGAQASHWLAPSPVFLRLPSCQSSCSGFHTSNSPSKPKGISVASFPCPQLELFLIFQVQIPRPSLFARPPLP